jgi:hypothetical protein
MFNRNEKHRKPKTVNEAAELLISDLLIQHLNTLSRMTEQEFNLLCEHVTPHLIDEFQIWEGNDDLLASCYQSDETDQEDPARIILNKVRDMLNNFSGFLVIT